MRLTWLKFRREIASDWLSFQNESTIKPFFGGLARVDGADQATLSRHAALLAEPRPKKAQPLRLVPVMARAMLDSDLYGRPL